MKKGLLSGLFCLCLIVSLLEISVRVNAAESDHYLGEFIITYDEAVGGAVFDNGDKSVRITGNGSYTIKMNPVAPNPSNQGILLEGEGDVKVTLNGVKIDRSEQAGKAAFGINKTNGTTTVVLQGNNELKSGEGRAGLENGVHPIVIEGPGILTAIGGQNGAGIGGGFSGNGSNITISGGTVTATGGLAGAGIGGGRNNHGSEITISGGTVTATGAYYGAGIGGGLGGDGSNITISGGTVTATGGENGAGIGSGYSGNGSEITISGGMVKATGGDFGAGIGSGFDGNGSKISISGGTVTATGGENGAGIGGGQNSNGFKITISGGTVTSTGGISGAGIGGGTTGYGSKITISGGTVTVTGGEGGADIGGGLSLTSADSRDNKILGGSVNTGRNIVHGFPANSPIKPYIYTFAGQANQKVSNLKSASDSDLHNTDSDKYGETDIYTNGEGKIYLWHVESTQEKNTMVLGGDQWVSDGSGMMSRIKPPTTPPTTKMSSTAIATKGGVPIEEIRSVIVLNPVGRVTTSTSDQKKTDAANQAKTAVPATAAASVNRKLPATGSSESVPALMAALVLALTGLVLFKKK